ncbi:DUF305 domain-containing protein [Antrihabitans stalactiti]
MGPERSWLWRFGIAVVLVAVGVGAGMWIQFHRHTDEGGVRLTATEIEFAQDMSVHHEQAVLLAHTLASDVDPYIRSMADQIIAAQTAEIATMRGWLNLVGEPFSPPHQMNHGGGPAMPGMASVEEITRLGTLHGSEAEIDFLQLMVRHHRGGVDMAQKAFNESTTQPVRLFALDMVQAQGNEIGMMTTMLVARNAATLAYP